MAPGKTGKDDKSQAARVRAYYAALAPDTRRQLKKIRDAILSVVPDATQVTAYGIPAFRVDGRILIYCAAFKEHASIYPLTGGMTRAHRAELEKYETSGKGTIRFSLSKPIPVPFIKRLVRTRLAEHRDR